ncbi:hypothetical protein E2C01_089654 [Portunus trituberculatus]|uniref:Uncharacterized protein n=1 Tax=Portunus trituberculatus TaxID=210409 RepID=A0A5B7JJD1_PORTR|nr:hypothetical protein [Portunus trituberculatus]
MPVPEALLCHRHLQLMPANPRLLLATLLENLSQQKFVQKPYALFEMFTPVPSPLIHGLHFSPAHQPCNAVSGASDT